MSADQLTVEWKDLLPRQWARNATAISGSGLQRRTGAPRTTKGLSQAESRQFLYLVDITQGGSAEKQLRHGEIDCAGLGVTSQDAQCRCQPLRASFLFHSLDHSWSQLRPWAVGLSSELTTQADEDSAQLTTLIITENGCPRLGPSISGSAKSPHRCGT